MIETQFWMGLAVGMGIGGIATFVITFGGRGDPSPVPTLLPRHRISKQDSTCLHCGTQMVDRYPHSRSARIHMVCQVCDYFDSYIDHDRVPKGPR